MIPARDEERTIERTVRSLLAQRYGTFEIVAVNDRSTDGTGAILEQLAGEDARVRVVHGVEPPEGWLGKPWALQQGASVAAGELLLFVDADIVYQPGALAAAVAYIEKSGSDFVALFPFFDMRGFWENILMPLLPMMGFVFAPIWLSNRLKVEDFAIGGGPGNLIRRTAYDAISQHEGLKNAVIDDIGLARRVRREGFAAHFVRADDLVSVRMYHGFHEIIDGFTKNVYKIHGSVFAVMLSFVGGALMIGTPYILALVGVVRLVMGLTPSRAAILSFLAVGLITVARAVMFAGLRYNLAAGILGYPLSLVVGTYLLARSTVKTGLSGKVTWRGRTYEKTTRFGD